jgi:hypothetical protein
VALEQRYKKHRETVLWLRLEPFSILFLPYDRFNSKYSIGCSKIMPTHLTVNITTSRFVEGDAGASRRPRARQQRRRTTTYRRTQAPYSGSGSGSGRSAAWCPACHGALWLVHRAPHPLHPFLFHFHFLPGPCCSSYHDPCSCPFCLPPSSSPDWIDFSPAYFCPWCDAAITQVLT